MKDEGYHPLFNIDGYLIKKLPQDVYMDIKSIVDQIQNNFTKSIPINKKLEGQIDKEYLINLTEKSTQYIKQTIGEYNKENPNYLNLVYNDLGRLTSSPTKKSPETNPLIYNGECWINFQEKYEYNPVHNHTGLFSFFIWYQIPYYKDKEVKYGAGKDRGEKISHNGEFEFIVLNENNIISYPLGIDKTMEGYIALFPSSLYHVVYPFYTSEEYRITISGNIHLQF